jgi:ABC-type nitrate/sulfonate/bicarbonate transport system permease component
MASMVVTLVAIVGVWALIVKGFGLNPYFAKTPSAVLSSLTSPLTGASERSELWSGVGVTLRDATLGYALGTAAAVTLAGAFVLWPFVQSAFMPIVVVLRAVPLVAMTPLLALVFGTGIWVVAAVAGIVTFVPSVVIIFEGLRSPPPASLDVFRAYGASSQTTLRRLRLPYALPALFAGAKIAVPGAVLGAVLAEWLVASDGLGRDMALAITESNFQILWAATAIVTALSAIGYNLLSSSEQAARARLG